MSDFVNYYQHLPENLSPIAFEIGNIAVKWYPLMYVAAFVTVFLLLKWRINRQEFSQSLAKSESQAENLVLNVLLLSFLGVILGGRIGYVLFYDLAYYLNDPWQIISPLDEAGNLVGIYGMSYHGGLLGVLLFNLVFFYRKGINFFQLADFIVPAIPAGYFWGRLGNFLNGELYGRVTAKAWGMYFDSSVYLRHPSQLYEAMLEGILLFVVLWPLRNKTYLKGKILVVYLVGYSFLRFVAEFWRAPDEQLGFLFLGLTMGQILSLLVIFLSFGAYMVNRRSKVV